MWCTSKKNVPPMLGISMLNYMRSLKYKSVMSNGINESSRKIYKLLGFKVGILNHHFIPNDVGVLLTYSDNLFIIFNLLAAIIVMFQLPVIIMLLLYFNLVTRSLLLRSSRYIIILVFIISAILTPPDVVSQLMVSLPLILLFFIVIMFAKVFRWGNHV